MIKEEKVKIKIQNSIRRKKHNIDRLIKRINNKGSGDCPFDVEMNGTYGTCTCGGRNRQSCLGDI